MASDTEGKGDARPASLSRGLPAAIVFLFIAIVGFVAVLAVGTGRMPDSGKQHPPTDQPGPLISSD
jgi:hypothetical protein